MKCLLKLFVFAVLGIVLLVGAGIALVDPMVQAAVTEGVGYTTQQETQLESADIGLFSGKLAFEGLEIANPPGFEETPLLRIGAFRTTLDMAASSRARIELDLVELADLELALELKGTESNVTQLIKRLRDLQEQLKETQPKPGGEAPPKSPSPEQAGPEIGIEKIRISGVSASLRISEVPKISGVYKLDVPDMLLENFSSDMDHATMIEWTAHVLETILTSALTAGEGQFPGQWQGLLAKGLKDEQLMQGDLSGVKKKLELEAKGELDEIIEGVKQDPAGQLDKSLDKLKKNMNALDGLLGGKKKGG
jgi:hypothetical protein